MAGFSFIFLYNSARIALQIYLSKSLRNKEKKNNIRDRNKKKRKVEPITDDLDKTHVIAVKEVKKKHDQGKKNYSFSMQYITLQKLEVCAQRNVPSKHFKIFIS